MPINKIVDSFDEAVADIEDGATIMIGGFGIVAGAPSLLLEALGRQCYRFRQGCLVAIGL